MRPEWALHSYLLRKEAQVYNADYIISSALKYKKTVVDVSVVNKWRVEGARRKAELTGCVGGVERE